MVTVHEKNSTTFNTLGLGTLLPTSCVVTEELNGAYELELSHPYDEGGKWRRIEIDNIIVASTPREKQAFRIYRIQPTLTSIVVNARHIFYDLLDNYISSFKTSGTLSQVLEGMKNSFNYSMPFSFSTNLTGTSSFSVAACNPISALLGDGNENDSVITKWGGELLRDNFSVAINHSIGKDRGVNIRYSKNLKGLTVDEDASNVVTRVFPFGKDGFAGSPIDSNYISYYPYPKVAKIENENCTNNSQLAAYVRGLFASGIDLPKVNIKADFQVLSKTEEYKNYSILEEVQLGDVVQVVNTQMNFSKKAKVISYKWNSLLEKYEVVELGDFVQTLAESITSGEKSLNAALGASTGVKQVYNLISGKVTVNENGLYIAVDTNSIDTATKLFHFGSNGLRYSESGSGGTWKTIIDATGNIITV